MALSGTTNEQKIWNYLKDQGFNDFGIAGLMGNLYAESGLIPTNLQNTYEKSLGYTDASYTAAVDDGSYNNFVKDSAGYGLAQWTYWSRKQGLLNHAKSAGKSIGDLEIQLEYLLKELTSYGLINDLKTATSVLTASNLILLQFEKPATKDSTETQSKRAGYGQAYYDKYAAKTTGGNVMTEKELRAQVVNIAEAWLGCKESDGSHKQIIDIYNAHKPLARGYKVKYTDAWCSTFASAVAIKAGLTDIIPTECGCEKHIALFQKLGRWQENDAYVPSAGDYVFYDWQDTGVGDNVGSSDHVGIVVSVSGNIIKVIEGNKNNAVGYRSLSVNGRYIRGFGLPDYAGKAGNTTSTITTVTAYQVRITVKNLNIRSGPGTGYSSKGYITPGVYTIIAESSGTGASKWGKLKSGEGWVSLDYCEKISSSTTATQSVSELDAAVDKLAKLGVINSPDYWKKIASGGTLKYLDQLFTKSAAQITASGTRFTNVTLAIDQLVKDGIINSPDYWTEHYKDCSSVDSLLCALAGAKKS